MATGPCCLKGSAEQATIPLSLVFLATDYHFGPWSGLNGNSPQRLFFCMLLLKVMFACLVLGSGTV